MKARLFTLVVIGTFALWTSASVHAQSHSTPAPNQHDHSTAAAADTPSSAPMCGMMDMQAMMATNAKLEALVKNMNAASGQAKTDAIATLLTTLVEDQVAMHKRMMEDMMPKMPAMPAMKDKMPMKPGAPK